MFDGTQLERFCNGTFSFVNQFRFVGEWKDGFIVKGVLYYKNSEMANSSTQMHILREIQGQGVLISSSNKWLYEGGLKDKKFHGYGWIYCSFQQYKHGTFFEDLLDGKTYKMSLNWGEITKGEYSMNKKTGIWERLTNSGYNIITGQSADQVTFPFINNDVFEGKVGFKRESYEVTFRSGVYTSVEKGRSEKKNI